MNNIEALEKLKQYQKIEGKHVSNGNETIKINKVVAAPSHLETFSKHYREFIESNVAFINALPNLDYDIYFYENPYKSVAFFIRLDDFLANYKVID